MNTELYDFLGQLAAAFKKVDQEDISLSIVSPAFRYIDSHYMGKEPMTTEQLAQAIAQDYKAKLDARAKWLAEHEAQFNS